VGITPVALRAPYVIPTYEIGNLKPNHQKNNLHRKCYSTHQFAPT
jgi:hypothetical protein